MVKSVKYAVVILKDGRHVLLGSTVQKLLQRIEKQGSVNYSYLHKLKFVGSGSLYVIMHRLTKEGFVVKDCPDATNPSYVEFKLSGNIKEWVNLYQVKV